MCFLQCLFASSMLFLSCDKSPLLWSSIICPVNPFPPKAKYLMSCYWGNNRAAAARRDQSLPYLEQYRIDMEQFKELFISLTPWACGAHTPVLAARLFRLLDENRDSLINFKEFVTGMSKWCFWRKWNAAKNASVLFWEEKWKEIMGCSLSWGGRVAGSLKLDKIRLFGVDFIIDFARDF